MKYIVKNYNQYNTDYFYPKYGKTSQNFLYTCEFCDKEYPSIDGFWLSKNWTTRSWEDFPIIYGRFCSEDCVNLVILKDLF